MVNCAFSKTAKPVDKKSCESGEKIELMKLAATNCEVDPRKINISLTAE